MSWLACAMQSCRVAFGGFQHETNTFAASSATYADFIKHDSYPGLVRGPALAEAVSGINLPVEGFLQAARASREPCVEVLPLLWCQAEPSGPVTLDAFERITQALAEDLASHLADGPVHGVYLDLHGAMVAEGVADGEAEIVRRLRRVVGDAVPIVCSLDWHANISDEMVELTDALTIYRTYPHLDMAETGARAFALLAAALGGLRIQSDFRPVPFLIPLTSQCSLDEPCRSLFEQLRRLEADDPELLSLDFAPGFPAADVPCCRPVVVAYAVDATAAEEAVERILEAILAAEGSFVNKLVGSTEAVRLAMEVPGGRGPVVLADVQDNPGAGGSCDTVGIARCLIEAGADAVVALIADAAAAQAAHKAGVGGSLHLSLGGRSPPADAQVPLDATFEVLALGDGRFACEGEMLRGMQANLGPAALLRVASTSVRILVASERFQVMDRAVLRHVGVEPEKERILVLKSSIHFRGDFDCIAAQTFLVESPGGNPCRPEVLPYRNLQPGLRLCPCGPEFSAALQASKRKATADAEGAHERPEFAVVETIAW